MAEVNEGLAVDYLALSDVEFAQHVRRYDALTPKLHQQQPFALQRATQERAPIARGDTRWGFWMPSHLPSPPDGRPLEQDPLPLPATGRRWRSHFGPVALERPSPGLEPTVHQE